MNEPEPNIALLQKTLTYIEDHPSEWNQLYWVCGTSACFAGLALLLSLTDEQREQVAERSCNAPMDEISYDGAHHHIRPAATVQLGLTLADAMILFNGTNTLGDLQDMVKDLSNGEQLTDRWIYDRKASGPDTRGACALGRWNRGDEKHYARAKELREHNELRVVEIGLA